MAQNSEHRQYRYYDFVMAAYVCVLLCSNLIGPAKETSFHVPVLGTVTFLAGVLFFPISYIFGDILTEVYGYARDRRVVWAGFAALAFASLMSAVIVHLPPSASSRATQPAVEAIFGNTPRIVAASVTAFRVRHFRQQLRAREDEDLDPGAVALDPHRRLDAVRRAGGFGDFLLPRLLRPDAQSHLVEIMFTQYALKCLWEFVATPLTYRVVAFLKRAENEDYYDIGTNFTPFSLRV